MSFWIIIVSILIGVLGPVALSELGHPWWVGFGVFVLFGVGSIILDILLLERRRKQPGFDPWDEI